MNLFFIKILLTYVNWHFMNLLTVNRTYFLEENQQAWRMKMDEGKMFFVQCLHRINIHSCTIVHCSA